jgi:hypothetical protein
MKDLLRTFYHSPDDPPGAGEFGDFVEEAGSEAVAEPAEAESTIEERVAKAVQSTLDARVAAEAEARLKAAQQQAELAGHTSYVQPATQAILAMDLREEIYDEIREIVGDAPKEVGDEVRKQLRQFNSYDALKSMRTCQIHKTLADAAIGRAIREGRYVPSGGKRGDGSTSAPSREPVHSEPPTRIPSEFRREQEEVCRQLGVTLTEQELLEGWRNR